MVYTVSNGTVLALTFGVYSKERYRIGQENPISLWRDTFMSKYYQSNSFFEEPDMEKSLNLNEPNIM